MSLFVDEIEDLRRQMERGADPHAIASVLPVVLHRYSLDVICVQCWAGPGVPCRTPVSGVERKVMHTERTMKQ